MLDFAAASPSFAAYFFFFCFLMIKFSVGTTCCSPTCAEFGGSVLHVEEICFSRFNGRLFNQNFPDHFLVCNSTSSPEPQAIISLRCM